uniref:Cytosolic fatty-acid binding proteins domain-containing protein n=1 Tax=Pygocentrus nattereri TaxID=42514 RepID=A0A3B4CRN6_PYGNA
MAVDFSGKWEMYEQSDPEEFLKAMGEMREVKPVTIIKQDGDNFEISIKTPLRTNTNCFTIGQETEFCAMNGMKCKQHCTSLGFIPHLSLLTEKLSHVREIQGEDMVETLTAGSATLVRRSRRV